MANHIETLPVEILHRIFDNIDAETILFSIRSISKLFRSIVHTYNRYNFHFKSISKSNFHVLCRLINPQSITSLTLYNDEQVPDQIDLFISLIRLRQLTRLHSINLFGIDELQLNHILKRIDFNFLRSFSLHIHKHDDRRKKTTEQFLSLILKQTNLRKIDFNIKNDRISNIKWPLNSKLEYLIINNNILFNDLCKIFSCSPQLHTLIIKQNLSNIINCRITKSSFPQLTSLIIDKLDVTMNNLQSLLVLTPSLTYLKLISETFLFDGKEWEEFIVINLPHLDKFEFFIQFSKTINQTIEDLDLYIQSFRTPFWIEYKKWFVMCEFNSKQAYKIQIYSLPICKSIYQHELHSEKIYLSTLPNYSLVNNNIKELTLSLKIPIDRKTHETNSSTTNPTFPNVTKLRMDVDRKIYFSLKEYLPLYIDISKLVEIKLESYYFNKDNKNILYDIITLIEQSVNLSSLIIHSRFCKYELYPFLNDLCSILPRQIKYLQIPINQIDQIKIILDRCLNLSVVQFEIVRTKFSTEVIQWFKENTIDSTCKRFNGCNMIWIGKKIDEINVNHKRIKLN